MSQTSPIRVLLVDDHEVTHTGLRHFLYAFDDLEPVGAAESGEEALVLCEQLRPDVVIMDLYMPGMGGIAAISAIRARFPSIRVLVLTSTQESEMIAGALKAGASGCLMKNISAFDLAQALRTVMAGRTVLAPEATEALVQRVKRPDPDTELTPREQEVLRLMAQGLSNSQIAARLHISAATVKFHAGGLFTKLGVSNRAEAIAMAYQRHLV